MAPPAAPARAQRSGARLSAPMGPGPSVAARPRPGHGLGAPRGAGGGRGPSVLMPGPARGGRHSGGRSAAVAASPGCWLWGCGLGARRCGGSYRCSVPLLCSSALLSSPLLPGPPPAAPLSPASRRWVPALTSRARVSMRPTARGPRPGTLALAHLCTRAGALPPFVCRSHLPEPGKGEDPGAEGGGRQVGTTPCCFCLRGGLCTPCPGGRSGWNCAACLEEQGLCALRKTSWAGVPKLSHTQPRNFNLSSEGPTQGWRSRGYRGSWGRGLWV